MEAELAQADLQGTRTVHTELEILNLCRYMDRLTPDAIASIIPTIITQPGGKAHGRK